MIGRPLQPYIANDDGFKRFVKLLDPRYVLPNKATIRDTFLQNAYESAK